MVEPMPFRLRAFSLVELLVAMTVIAILAGLILASVGVVRERARRVEAQQVVDQLVSALETYQASGQPRRHYPLQSELYPTPAPGFVPHPLAMSPQLGASAGVLALLDHYDLMVRGSNPLRDGVLIDPWGRPYAYQLTRPTPTVGSERLHDWNWDVAASRAKQRNRTGGDTDAPFPYVFSLGKNGDPADASAWIYRPDSRP
jgi:prepilin-type N-terminal cleavage/methylation domain-containing protein